jgi:hypothetical protein
MNGYRFSVGHVKPFGPPRPDPEHLNDLWERWLLARTRAMETGKLQDGIEAGRAWRTFLEQFTSPPLVPTDDGGVS